METYHGTDRIAQAHIGLCLTDAPRIAEGYAEAKNAGTVITRLHLNLADLTVAEVDYNYDECEPIIPAGCTADVVEYLDSDMYGTNHTTWMLRTPAALAACTVVGHYTLTVEQAA